MNDEVTLNDLKRWDREIVWHAFSQMAEYDGLIVQSAEGCWLTTVDGQRYLDGASSLWCNVHGHRHPSIDQAVIEQLSQVAHVTSLGMSHPTTIRLAKRLVDLAPLDLNHVFFSSDGASAVEVAMKLAFQYWRQCSEPQPHRDLFLAVGQAYHGDTIGTSSVGGVSRFRDVFSPILFPVLRGPCPDSYRAPDSTGSSLTEYYLDAYEAIFEKHHARIASVIIEPLIQAAAGIVVHPPGFLRGLAALARRYDTLLIADEVAVGMGRTGKMFACEHEDVSPDLMCLGKGLTGGYLPMSATLCSNRIWNAFLGDHRDGVMFYYGHTFTGNPLSAAAANATLDIFEAERTLDEVVRKSALLENLLRPLEAHPNVGSIRQRGLIAAVELVAEKASKLSYPSHERRGAVACREALRHQVWLRPLGDVIPIVPALAMKDEDIHRLVQAVIAGVERASCFRLEKA